MTMPSGNVRSMSTLVDEIKKKNPNIVPLLPLFGPMPMVQRATKEFATKDYSKAREEYQSHFVHEDAE